MQLFKPLNLIKSYSFTRMLFHKIVILEIGSVKKFNMSPLKNKKKMSPFYINSTILCICMYICLYVCNVHA